MLFADIQQFNSDIFAKISALYDEPCAAPERLDFLEFRMVHDCIKLFTDFLIQIVDMKIQQAFVEFNHVLARLRQTGKQNVNRRRHALIG